MARGDAGKLRRRKQREEKKKALNDFFGPVDEAVAEGTHDFGPEEMPLPPGMAGAANRAAVEEDSSAEEEEPVATSKKKKKSKSATAGDIPLPTKKEKGIKSTPLILLILMTGSTLLPALIFASDFLGNFLQKHHVLGQIGFRLGMGAVPRKRVLSFYEKHDPDKLADVPDILSKYYGDYPTLVKRLERKYHDYGYFLGWEEDEAPLTLALEKVQETYDIWLQQYWNRYAPQVLKTAARNIRYNLGFLQKKLRKAWKKTVWPLLEPFLGVPKGGAAQKRKDAAEARKMKQQTSGGTGTRRRNTDFRDDEEN